MPPAMNNDDLYFIGWYKEPEFINLWNFNDDVVTGNTTLYAKWVNAVLVSGSSWNEKMRWLEQNVQSDNAYSIEFNSDESINPITFSYSGKNNISLTLKGTESKRIISLNNRGSMFTIGSDVTLILDSNLELQGSDWNNASLVTVNSGGNLILNNGARITGNTYSGNNPYGGGVSVYGTLTMNGGEISGNNARHGGGVYVSGGTFTMNGGVISSNTSNTSTRGGGVYVSSGTFTMNGGEISDNSSNYSGGGVYVNYNSTFTMNDGKISGNTAFSYGGGVYVGGTFTMNDGKISGNNSGYGGGVYGAFTMNGGEISGNNSNYGGGVYVNNYSRGQINTSTL
jgi:hypothetical protein